MVSNFNLIDIKDINRLGEELNKDFIKLFHIDNLNPNEKIYVYREDNQVIGFIHISINYEIADILNIIVDKDYRNHHIASILMDYMITELPNAVKKIMLEVNEENIPAIKFYQKFNFNIINERKNYYGASSALIMERIIR